MFIIAYVNIYEVMQTLDVFSEEHNTDYTQQPKAEIPAKTPQIQASLHSVLTVCTQLDWMYQDCECSQELLIHCCVFFAQLT